MKFNLINSTYDSDTGISTATIETKYGVFTGTSKLYDMLYSEDTLASIRVCEALGAKFGSII